MARALATLAALACLTRAAAARAEEADPQAANTGEPMTLEPNRLRTGFAAMTRPVGIAEFNVGVLTLPGAEVCVERSTGCKEGDVVFGFEGWELYRWNLRWAFGAGVMVGLFPTAHPPQPPEAMPRDHTRSYFTFEGMFRYYAYVGDRFEAWLGPVGGLVVVSDRFEVVDGNDDRALLGPQGVTLRTEGGSIGLAMGMAHSLGQHWAMLGSLRVSQWFLAWAPAHDPLGAEASLAGRNTAILLNFGISYRASL
jgi:hypothetical protein